MGVTAIANFSGIFLAILLGDISPKIRTNIVMTAVDNVTPRSPQNLTKITVAKDADKIFTILLPTKIVVNMRSKSSANFRV